MKITLNVNNTPYFIDVLPSDTLLRTLRKLGFYSVKSGGCQKGECGACAVLIDGKPVNTCTALTLQAEGHSITTIEYIGEHPDQGWKKTEGFSILQEAFIKSGAVQCGYCTPAMILAAKSILDNIKNPTDKQIQEAISGVICRCTGYKKPIQAIKASLSVKKNGNNLDSALAAQKILPEMEATNESSKLRTVGQPDIKVDAIKLVQGKPAFTDDFEIKDMLFAKILHSPVAHARIRNVDVEKARALPGVAAVLTWKDLPRVIYSTAGQSDPIPGPLDMFSLDNVVRFVGDRVAFVAAETEMIAEKALNLIKVDYEELPSLFDSSQAMKSTSPQLHTEKEFVNFGDSNPKQNLAAKIRIDIGNVDLGFSKADRVFESDYEVSKVQQAHIEPHVAISYWDEDDRLVIRTSTQVPFHARRILAPLLGLPVKRIRVIKPRIGGGFGGKQEILIEDVVAHLTIATKHPVRLEYTREEEFTSSRSRHPMKIHLKTGVLKDGTITANDMYILTDTGAYGCHALTVTGNTGHKAMALYVGDGEYRKSPNIRFYADIVYTNHPPAGAFRGYGVPQGYWAVERHMEKIARSLKLNPIDFRLKNALKSGELHPFSTAWSEGREPKPEIVHTVGLSDCVKEGMHAIDWDKKFGNSEWHIVKGKPYLRRGIGLATVMQGTAIPYLDMGGASIKMNEDGSFNLLIGATDLGTGSDTVLAQMAAEVLGVHTDDILVYSSDTDFTPFDKGAYASSTTYISGAAVVKAAEKVAERIKIRASTMFNLESNHSKQDLSTIHLADRAAVANDGRRITMEEIALESMHHNDQEQIMAVASYMSPSSPPPFAAQFAEVLVDIETGKVSVEKLVMAVDSGTIVNPLTASGQIEGGMAQALGYAVCEEMTYDEKGNPREKDFVDYHVFRSNEMPELETIFVQTYEPTHPFGVKAAAEIPLDGVAPAVGNAVKDACGADVDTLPITPEKIWTALQQIKK